MTGRCPTPDKARYATRGQAASAVRLITQRGEGQKMRIYRCECGSYHLTSQV